MITLQKLTPGRIAHAIAIRSGARNALNRKKYGPDAPQAAMHLRIHPNDIIQRYFVAANNGTQIHHWQTGQVIDGDWDLSTKPFQKSLKFRACRQHFIKGAPWEKTVAWPYGLRRIKELGKYDACKSAEDLARRYDRLDDLWTKIVANDCLPKDLDENTTSRTGILVHIAHDGQLLFGNQGFHRLAMCKLAKIPQMVVVVGIVHPDALQTEAFHRLLRQKISPK